MNRIARRAMDRDKVLTDYFNSDEARKPMELLAECVEKIDNTGNVLNDYKFTEEVMNSPLVEVEVEDDDNECKTKLIRAKKNPIK